MTLSDYIDSHIVEWTVATVENDCKMMAGANGLPNHLIDKIETKHTNYMTAEVQNNYTKIDKNGKEVPIGRFVNSGWKEHMIYGNPILHWVDGLGIDHFARHVKNPGFEGYHFMEVGKQTGLPALVRLVESKAKQYYKGGLSEF